MANTRSDQIMADLIAAGHITGSIADRERARLLAKAGLVAPQPHSLQDLYRINAERPRLY